MSRFHALFFLCATMIEVFAPQSQSNAQGSGSFSQYAQQAAKYQLKDLRVGKELSLIKTSILNYSNPVRFGGDGSVFLWTDDSIPMVIGTCFTYVYQEETRRKNAFQVLSNRPIQATFEGQQVWLPRENSLSFRPVPASPVPGSNARERKTQLKVLSRQFSLEITNRDGSVEQCRLMPRPLYYYETDGRSGAIFSFAVGTDPEAILILDRTLNEQGTIEWQYAWARFTFYALAGAHKGQRVWQVERSENLLTSILQRPDYQRQPYVTFRPEYLD